MVDEPVDQEVRALGAVCPDDGVDRLDPLLGLDGIDIAGLAVFGHGSGLRYR